MTELLQMAGNITYSTASNYVDLLTLFTTVQLIGMAYHPLIQNLLFMVYAIPGNSNIVKMGHLQIWEINKSNRSIVYNNTLQVYMTDPQKCQFELSSQILLIECVTHVKLFGVKLNGKSLINETGFQYYNKTNFGMVGNQIQRCFSVYKQKLAYFNGTFITIKDYRMDDTIYGVRNKFSFYLGPINNLFSILMSQDYVIWGLDEYNSTIAYTYLPCILYGYDQYGNSCSTNNIVTFFIGNNVTQNFRIKQANSSDSKYILWLLLDGDIFRYQLLPNGPVLKQQLTGFNFKNVTYNNKYIVFYNSSRIYHLRSFQTQTVFSQIDIRSSQLQIKMAAINPTRTQLTVFNGSIYQVAQQYLITDNCSAYNTSKINGFCKCQSFDGIYCTLLLPSSEQNKGLPAFVIPVVAVSAAVGVTLLVIVTQFLYKKYCKAPKNNRVPYKYDQVQLMSFQM